MRRSLLPIGLIVAIALAVWTVAGRAADQASGEAPRPGRAVASAKTDRNWAAYGGDKGGMKYSPLDQINKDTVKNLRIAWRKSGVPDELKGSFPEANAPANYQHTPLMVDGVLYMSSSVGSVVAL